MKQPIRIVIAVFGLALLGSAAARAQERPADPQRYAVIDERNIFLRNRARPAPPPPPTSRPAPPPPEKSMVLRGIVLEDDEYRAYVENTDSGSMLRLKVSDAVARGTVGRIGIDGFAYQQGESETWVDVGRDLMGDAAATPSRSPYFGSVTGSSGTTGSSGSTTPTTAAVAGTTTQPAVAGDPNDPSLSMAERMRLRRQMELNRP